MQTSQGIPNDTQPRLNVGILEGHITSRTSHERLMYVRFKPCGHWGYAATRNFSGQVIFLGIRAL